MRYRRYAMGSRQTLTRRLTGAGLSLAGGIIVIKVFPLWIWPVFVGLWMFWAGLGPVLVGLGLIWLGWKLLSRW
ncbi:hypothetical protein [Sulfobacillus thermosulfidooxidans]|uniref:Uncharacterized protein n=1 Tax=Sulfobacillus thermosulfidooxidans (strain DSM 9293 / VKM B-1269 / AT-1) TaxID=929705 RepID=A0A1W1WP59_SULTA|nr:hypothetical protein [Sulfobacillus thermosulfidooxidans]SMC07503.1 hypothetical protein SAMN00768000_3421 [Sulfobacillus thermosulfidooxidans DSM 9293]